MSDVICDELGQVNVQCNNLNVEGTDFVLDFPARRKPNGPRLRRALVHDFNDGLTVNFAGDYPGGITLVNVAQILPKDGRLVVRGGISYEAQGVQAEGGGVKTITVVVDEELADLQFQIRQLSAKVAALEAKN